MHTAEHTALVTPQNAYGTVDILPAEMLARNEMIETIRRVYELYGFLPLNTPAIERSEVLYGSAGPEAEKSAFHVIVPDEDEHLSLRYDLTVPLARVLCQHPELPRPFRRYQVSPVYRADKPGPGRFREFTQFDLDSVGVPSEVADTEVIAAMCDTLEALDPELRYVVRMSSRGVLDLLLPFAGISRDRGPAVFRALDKIDRVGIDNVRKELMEGYRDESGALIQGIRLTIDQVERVEMFLNVQSDRREDLISALHDLFSHIEGADARIDVLARVSHQLHRLGYHDDRVVIDLSIARGLAYYTGPIYEAYLPDAPQFGSVFSGGRYDNLTQRYSDEKLPATGASIGVDRLLAALTHLRRIKTRPATAYVLITCMDQALMDDYIDMTWELRRAGIAALLYLGEEASLGKQLKYADRCAIPIAVLYGADENAHKTVIVKNLAEGKRRATAMKHRDEWLAAPAQETVHRSELIRTVLRMIGENGQ